MAENSLQIQTKQKKNEVSSNLYNALGIIACLGGLVFQLITGSLYQWGIINIYVTSYFKSLDPSLTLESNAIAFPIMMFCMGLPMRLGIYLAEITHPIIVIVTCQILLSASVFISSYVTSMWVFIFFYGIMFGLLVGTAFMIPIIECNKYFPGKKMYVNGVILIGTGSGSVVFGMFSYSFLNPLKLKPLLGYYLGNPELLQIAEKVPILLRYLALLYLCLGLIGISMMAPVIFENRHKQNMQIKRQEDERQQNIRIGVAVQPLQKQPGITQDHEAHSLCQAFGSMVCWVEVLIVLFTSCGLYLINGNYKTYVKNSINDDQYLTIIGAVGATANGCSRFVWNVLFSRTGYKTVMLIILGISTIVLSTIRFTVQIKQAYFVEVFLINCCIGGLLVSTPTVVQAIYGQKTGSNIYGFYWEIVALGNFIAYLYVSNLSKTIGFDNVIYICLGMTIVAVPVVIFTKFQGPWKNQTISLEYCVGDQIHKIQQQLDHTLQQFHEHQLQMKQKQKRHASSQVKQWNPKQMKLQPLSHQYLVTNQHKINSLTDQKLQTSNFELIAKPAKVLQAQQSKVIQIQKKPSQSSTKPQNV